MTTSSLQPKFVIYFWHLALMGGNWMQVNADKYKFSWQQQAYLLLFGLCCCSPSQANSRPSTWWNSLGFNLNFTCTSPVQTLWTLYKSVKNCRNKNMIFTLKGDSKDLKVSILFTICTYPVNIQVIPKYYVEVSSKYGTFVTSQTHINVKD